MKTLVFTFSMAFFSLNVFAGDCYCNDKAGGNSAITCTNSVSACSDYCDKKLIPFSSYSSGNCGSSLGDGQPARAPATYPPTPDDKLPESGKYYYIVSRVSGLNLDVLDAECESKRPEALAAGAPHGIIVQAKKHPKQQWKLEKKNGDEFWIKSRVCEATASNGGYLDVMNADQKVAAKIVVANRQDTQTWRLSPAEDGFYYVQSQISQLNLDVGSGSQKEAARIVQGNPHKLQVWKFIRAE